MSTGVQRLGVFRKIPLSSPHARPHITLDPETAQRLAERAREGVTPEEFAAHVVWDVVADYDPNDLERYPPLAISDEEFRASLEAQMREIEAGTAITYSHAQVMAGMRAKIEAAIKKRDD